MTSVLLMMVMASAPTPVEQLPPPPVGVESAPSPAAVGPSVSTSPRAVRLSVEAPQPGVVLYRAPAHPSQRPNLGLSLPTGSMALCSAPCSVTVDAANAQFFLGGEGMPVSSSFKLPEQQSEITVVADPGSSPRQWLGVALVAGAGLVALYSLILFFELLVLDAAFGGSGASGFGPLRTISLVGLTASLALGGGGVALMMSGRTLYRFGPSQER